MIAAIDANRAIWTRATVLAELATIVVATIVFVAVSVSIAVTIAVVAITVVTEIVAARFWTVATLFERTLIAVAIVWTLVRVAVWDAVGIARDGASRLLRPVIVVAIIPIVAIAEPIVLLTVATIGPVATLLAITVAVVVAAIAAALIAVVLPVAVWTTIRPIVLPVIAIGLALRLVLRRVTRAISTRRCLVRHRGLRGIGLRTAAEIFAAFRPAFVVHAFTSKIEAVRSWHALWRALSLLAGRLELFAVGHDDAVIVFGVLKIILSQNAITRRLRVARQCQIFLGDVRRRAANFNVRSV